jgi:asparagine synthase (glutamine-hydrolysing)
LSIIDLSDAAAQPMVYDETGLWITYNGEIYNYIELKDDLTRTGYKFRTSSDTEVILAAYDYWGESCVQHFNGMYAFALWDERRGILFCARDPVGIKPFYYILTDRFFAFASESTALYHLVEGSLSRNAVAAYFLCMYVPGPWSIIEGIKKLSVGTTLTVTPSGQARPRAFGKIDDVASAADDDEQRDKIHQLIRAAVRRQLRSDVPVGTFLSGGIDSSLVVAIAAENKTDLHTFSAGFEGSEIDELPHARYVAERYGTRHHELILKGSEILDSLDSALEAMNEPVADSAIVPTYLLSRIASSEGVKVLLSGTGGDEAFGGYSRYVSETWRRLAYEKMPRSLQRWFGKTIGNRNSVLAARFEHMGFDLAVSTGGSPWMARAVFESDEEFLSFASTLARECFPRIDRTIPILYNKMFFDLRVYLVDELLILLDQMTMAWTLEGRVPLLDVDVIKEAFRFPAKSHVNRGKTKTLLRNIAAFYLGADFVERKKQGFGGPVAFWVHENIREMVDTIFSFKEIPYLAKTTLDRFRVKGMAGAINIAEANEMFSVYCFIKWYERLRCAK